MTSAMEGTRNWIEMPHEIMVMILQKFDGVVILERLQKVCTTWRRICKDPAMWKVINMSRYFDGFDEDYDIEKLTKQAVHRSCGELIDISLKWFGNDDLLDFISRWHSSSKLKSFRLESSDKSLTSFGLIQALKRLPHLETLELNGIPISSKQVEVVGQSCPQLKSFRLMPRSKDFDDGYGRAIANSMPAICRLQLVCVIMDSNALQAILDGCPHLESLDLCLSCNLGFDENLVKLCRERIKDFKYPDITRFLNRN